MKKWSDKAAQAAREFAWNPRPIVLLRGSDPAPGLKGRDRNKRDPVTGRKLKHL